MAGRLRMPFPGAAAIPASYAQAWQDIFVLSMLGGLRRGRYLEVGGQQPRDNNNTYLLHKNFDWQGVTLEIDRSLSPAWASLRPASRFVVGDALKIDYAASMPVWFGEESLQIDYLQLDIDPSLNTLSILKKLPLDRYRFSTITFETDAYTGDFAARDESREILRTKGYELVAADVAVLFRAVSKVPIPFEDWWVDPRAVDHKRIEAMKSISPMTDLPREILFT